MASSCTYTVANYTHFVDMYAIYLPVIKPRPK